MLKIIGNVNKLKDYGFEYKTCLDYYGEKINAKYYRKKFDSDVGINVFLKSCKVDFDRFEKNILYIMDDQCRYIESTVFTIPDIIYDLIKAGIVGISKE